MSTSLHEMPVRIIPVPWIGPVWFPLALDAIVLALTWRLWWPRRA